jgi:putative endonuclease
VRFKTGEIDIVAMDGTTLCFVEVKSRVEGASVSPWEAITPLKQRKIRQTAEWYLLRKRPEYESCRFDAVSVVKKPDGRYMIERLKNCF